MVSERINAEPVRLTWDEWKAARVTKREVLRRLGLDAPSRRTESTSDRRLRAAFGGERAPLTLTRGDDMPTAIK